MTISRKGRLKTIAINLRRHIIEAHKRRGIVDGENKLWVGTPCISCGDSPNPKSVHLFIKLPFYDDGAIVKYCHQPSCDFGGAVTKEDLIKLGITNKEVINKVAFLNKKFKNQAKASETEVLGIERRIPYDMNEAYKDYQIEYIKDRTGVDPKYNDWVSRYRMVPDVMRFMYENDTNISGKAKYVIEEYVLRQRKRYVAFLNDTGSELYMRLIDNKDKEKHLRVPIKELPETVRPAGYSLNRGFNEYYGEGYNKIFLCEGIFNMINMVESYSGTEPALFIAVGSAKTMKFYFKLIATYYKDVNIFVAKDADISDNFYKYILKGHPYKIDQINIIENLASNDIGDKREPMDIRHRILKLDKRY